MPKLSKKVIKITVGSLLIVLGVASGFLPFLQGWIFNLIGFILIAEEVPFLRKYLHRLEAKYPKQFEWMHARRRRLSERVRRWLRRPKEGE